MATQFLQYPFLLSQIKEVEQELNHEEILDGIISCVAENEIRALVRTVVKECHVETVTPQQQQVNPDLVH